MIIKELCSVHLSTSEYILPVYYFNKGLFVESLPSLRVWEINKQMDVLEITDCENNYEEVETLFFKESWAIHG